MARSRRGRGRGAWRLRRHPVGQPRKSAQTLGPALERQTGYVRRNQGQAFCTMRKSLDELRGDPASHRVAHDVCSFDLEPADELCDDGRMRVRSPHFRRLPKPVEIDANHPVTFGKRTHLVVPRSLIEGQTVEQHHGVAGTADIHVNAGVFELDVSRPVRHRFHYRGVTNGRNNVPAPVNGPCGRPARRRNRFRCAPSSSDSARARRPRRRSS